MNKPPDAAASRVEPREMALAHVEAAEQALEHLMELAREKHWFGIEQNARDLWIDLQEVRGDLEDGHD